MNQLLINFLNFSTVRFAAIVLVAILFSAGVAGAWQPAPEADPFGAGGRPVEKAKAATPAEATVEPLAIELLRASNPAAPADLLRAAKAALEFGRPDESKRYLAKLLASQPKDETLAAQSLKFGDFLFRLSAHKEVQPEGKQVADLVFAAGRKAAENPELIGKLSAADSLPRQEALVKLSQSGVVVIPPLISTLADASRAKDHVYIQAALVRLSGVSLRPLLAALESLDHSFQARVIETLGYTRSNQSAVHLVRPAIDPASPPIVREAARAALNRLIGAVPDSQEARQFLTREAQRLWQGNLPIEPDADGLIEIWSWDAAEAKVFSHKLAKSDASAALAARLASDLHALIPKDAAAQRLMLLARLELAKSQHGLDRPLPFEPGTAGTRAAEAGPQVMNNALAAALQQARIPAAIAVIEVLAKIGDDSVLETHGGMQSPLADALTFSDRRVRVAAAFAAARLAPVGEYVGASRVHETLSWLSRSQGMDLALVADPRVEVAQTTIALANSAGYGGLPAYTGTALAAEAFVNSDLQFILIDEAIDSPPILDVVQWLRRDYRTARIPVGVMVRTERLDALQQLFVDDRFTIVFPRLHSAATAATAIENLKAIAGRNLVGAEERLAQAQEARETLARIESELAKQGRSIVSARPESDIE